MAKAYELETRPGYMHDVHAGTKPFEVREDDRGYLVDDYLVFREYVQQDVSGNYADQEAKVIVTHTLRDSCYIRPGYVAMGI